MTVPFSRTLRALEGDRSRVSSITMICATFVLGGWLAWFAMARVPISLLSVRARLEVAGAPHQVCAAVSGRIVRIGVRKGQFVEAGAVILELDSGVEEAQFTEESAGEAGSVRETDRLKAALASERWALPEADAASEAEIEEAKARVAAAEAADQRAADSAARSARLASTGLLSEKDLLADALGAAQRGRELDAQQAELRRLVRQKAMERHERQARIDLLERDLEELSGEMASAAAAANRALEEIERRKARAPIAGQIGWLSELKPGAVVMAGEPIATVLPDGELKVLASFPSSGLGRIRAGQAASMRVDGFPWLQYGGLEALVVIADQEAHEGLIHVEARIQPTQSSKLPAAHGMPGTLAVEVERLSPLALVLRAAGQALGEPSAEPAPQAQ